MGVDTARLALYLEYVDGRNLATFADKQSVSQLSLHDQFRVLKDISGAIRYIHDHDILHQDIKPENVILGSNDRGAVLCDFGISVKASQKGEPSCAGTPCFIPPEFLLGERGPPADVWAFGVTMLYAIGVISLPCGKWKIRDVISDDKTNLLMRQWLTRVASLCKVIPSGFTIIRDMLCLQPDARITAKRLELDLSSQSRRRGTLKH